MSAVSPVRTQEAKLLKELSARVQNFLDFEEELEIGPDCPDPDGHERLTSELLELLEETGVERP